MGPLEKDLRDELERLNLVGDDAPVPAVDWQGPGSRDDFAIEVLSTEAVGLLVEWVLRLAAEVDQVKGLLGGGGNHEGEPRGL